METPTSRCSVCNKPFAPKFRYQVREEHGQFVYFCSQTCHALSISDATCSTCGTSFQPEYAFQVRTTDDGTAAFCSLACLDAEAPVVAASAPRGHAGPKRIA
ncbi:MAG: hypothetical protein ACOYOJ_21130, partial [Alsobacter sp.]